MPKYDYDRTDKVVYYPNRDTVGTFLLQGNFTRGPFTAVRQGAYYSGFYVAIYVDNERVAFEDVVYSLDSTVIQAVKEFASTLAKAAAAWKHDEEEKDRRHRVSVSNNRRSLFADAVRKWKG